MKLSKKGRTLMTFVKVSGKPTKDETETLTKLWQTSLWNNHIQAERYFLGILRSLLELVVLFDLYRDLSM